MTDSTKSAPFQQALDIRIAQGWQLGGNACPVLYTDTVNGEQVCRDDLWLATTAGLKGASPPPSPVAQHAEQLAPSENRARLMADEVMAELEAIGTGWDEEDIDRIQGTLLPRTYDCLNLLAIVTQQAEVRGVSAVSEGAFEVNLGDLVRKFGSATNKADEETGAQRVTYSFSADRFGHMIDRVVMDARDSAAPGETATTQAPSEAIVINGEPATAHSMLAALIDIYDDTQSIAPEHRCYVESAWPEALADARRFLAAPVQSTTHAPWAAYIAAVIETYLNFDRPKEGRELAIAGIIERRMWSFPAQSTADGERAPVGRFTYQLDEAEAAMLRDFIGKDEDDGEASEITLWSGDGHSGPGLYVSLTEYPDEGSVQLVASPTPPQASPTDGGEA